MIAGLVKKIIKFSAVDGPGNRCAVFLQGCNLDCVYCHNPETIALKSMEAKIMTVDEVYAEIGGAVDYVRGITVSGGECMLQRDFVLELFKAAKSLKLTTFIDTNGTYSFESDSLLLDYTDGIMLDVKSANDDEHKRITGFSNKPILRNMKFLAESGKLYEVRTVLSEQLINCKQTVDFVSSFIGNYKGVKYKLIKYRTVGTRRETTAGIKIPDDELIIRLKEICRRNNVDALVV